ncbi:hypothetical protein C8Q74DRAFT_135973 [Fomes fomentarius]|nr:hypothetical protein C8Q74DRAFT_135973 [Fomes fomentarius]
MATQAASSTTASKDSHCPGCNKVFTVSGLSKHLSLTHKPECVAIRGSNANSLLQSLPTSSTSTPFPLTDPHFDIDIELDSEPIPFDGDFFGNYTPDDFESDDHPAPAGLGSESDSDDEPVPSGWEPKPQQPLQPLPDNDTSPPSGLHTPSPSLPSCTQRTTAEESARKACNTFVDRFPSAAAGAPLLRPINAPGVATYSTYQQDVDPSGHNPYAPFASRLDWEIARWAKLRGSGSTAFTDLLAIEEVAQRLELSYKNSRELNKIIDDKLPSGRPRFHRHEIVIAEEAFEVYFRNILECVEALFGDPEFAPILLLVPERHYADADRTIRVYFDMNTGKWWWATQTELERQHPGATVIPIIISSDKTQLTVFGNKTAYPVYMTLGNLPKDIRCKPSRRGQILLAYLPTSRLLHITNKAARRRTLANLFHACMTRVLSPLASVGVLGMELATGMGTVYRGHPILATYVGDYPEQLLVTGVKYGECPKCPIPRNDVGNTTDTSRPLRDLEKVLDALSTIDDGPHAFTRACRDAGIKPLFHPFWEALPYTNIFLSVTPDILHQLYQGVVKHLLAWLQDAYGATEIDARCRRLPPNHNLRHFSKGLSSLSRVTGKEHQDICRILIGLIIGLRLPSGTSAAQLVRATRALLDFLYLAQYRTHTTSTLTLLDDALEAFHANKDIIVQLGIRIHFHFPKLHSLDHYRRSIELFGTTDNYDTQYSERLHIDLAKDAYRATNHKDELSQMTLWLERKEKIQRHEKFVQWRLAQPPLISATSVASPDLPTMFASTSATSEHGPGPGRPHEPINKPRLHIEMAKHPSASIALHQLPIQYSAAYFRDALTRFIVTFNHPTFTGAQVEHASAGVYLNFRRVPVYNKVKFWITDPHGLAAPECEARDVIHVRPSRKNKHGADVGGRFDTALVRIPGAAAEGSTLPPSGRFRVAQVRVVFKIPFKCLSELFPNCPPTDYPQHLAYVEWFTPLTSTDPDHGLYKIARALRHGSRLASIIPINQLERSCHLFPDFGPVAPRHWSSSTVLDECPAFFVNAFTDRYTYKLIY